MKILTNIPVYFLTIIYFVFGLNFFLHFIPMPPMSGNAGNFATLLYSTGYLTFVKVLEVLLALLIIIPKTRALALLLIAPISLNILLFEIFMTHQLGIGVVLVLLNAIAIYHYKQNYLGIVGKATT